MMKMILMECSHFFTSRWLGRIFRHLVKGGSFPACCRLNDALKIFEKIVAGKFSPIFKGQSASSF